MGGVEGCSGRGLQLGASLLRARRMKLGIKKSRQKQSNRACLCRHTCPTCSPVAGGGEQMECMSREHFALSYGWGTASTGAAACHSF